MSTLIFGHKNPDTDSVTSAVAFSYLKNKLGFDTTPCVLGEIRKESKYVLDYFKLPYPIYIENVKTQVKDLNYDKVEGISSNSSILYAYKLMESNHLRTLPVVCKDNKLIGILTMKDIAMELIRGDFHHITTSLSNISNDLNGTIVLNGKDTVSGKISVMAFYYDSIKGTLCENDIIIVGDRYDIIEYAIDSKVQLIIVTGGKELPEKYINMAKSNNVSIISVPMDTYTTSRLINQCSYVSSMMMNSKDIIKFNENEYLDEIRDDIIDSNFRNYPVVDEDNNFLGFIARKHLLNPAKKKVILVDHNEYAQSADGLEESEILEIVDHHKIGGISTSIPINFRNMTVGSTCTIVYNMFKEYDIEIPREIAGLLISGIVSDTLLFKSPTTTSLDKKAVEDLNLILNLDLDKYAMDMFKAGTSLEGFSIKDIFYRDFKEFNLEGIKSGIGQVFTLDIDAVFDRKEEFLDFINKTHDDKNYGLTLLVITDILKEGSYLLYKSNNSSIIPTAFKTEDSQGVFVDGLVSRKKQVVPKLLEAINIIK